MTITINALDSQFAASTGSNVNSGPGTSTFDYPPASTSGLVIESQPGDDSPYIFSPGDTYTLSFTGQGGDTIQNATVVRSDYIDYGGDTGYAVVFEGLDSNGDLTQIVWTPEFDLESWYWNNFSGGEPPQFYNSDQDASTTYQAVCFEASMPIETPEGARAAGEIRPGDRVMTLDHGAQEVTWCAARRVRGWGRHAPVVFAPGSLGNDAPLVLSQQHRLLFEIPEEMADTYGPQVLIPAVAFVDGHAVRLRPRDWISYVHLLLAEHDMVFSQGVACESLYLGQVARDVLAPLARESAYGAEAGSLECFLSLFSDTKAQEPARPLLSPREGQRLLHRVAGVPERKPAMFLRRGRKHARPYHLDPGKYLDAPGLKGLPAFVSLIDTGA
ncbi:Hint domain-containing protein [Celeribacter neptunius]|uniref:Hint domain-containing protein n=1 Tax=Celeribacter neptunius TaxID=588602 RepID=A0A1I3PCQ8_9RHOB|nr:Hint domain-containing protein [Celeribacter neptunius]SFJ19328.1 Hint domain-containing protein [Celeribacter neptunius]